MNKDRLTGIVLGLVSMLFLYMTWALPEAKNSTVVGSDVFPYMAAGGLLLCSIALVSRRDGGGEKDGPFLDGKGWFRVAKLLGLLLLFPLLFHILGFVVAALVFLFLMISLFDLEREVPLWKAILVSIAVTATLFIVFTHLLKIQLPQGVAIDLIKG